MSDGISAPGGEDGGLPPDVQAHKARMEDPVWKAKLTELEAEVHRALAAVFAHAGDVSALSIPVDLPDGSKRAVVAGDPIALFAVINGEGPRLLLNKHMIVGTLGPREMLMSMAMAMLRGGGQAAEDDEEVCDCPRCVAQRANPH